MTCCNEQKLAAILESLNHLTQKFISLEQRFSTFDTKVTNNKLKIQVLELEQKSIKAANDDLQEQINQKLEDNKKN